MIIDSQVKTELWNKASRLYPWMSNQQIEKLVKKYAVAVPEVQEIPAPVPASWDEPLLTLL